MKDFFGSNGWLIKDADVLPGSGLVLRGISHGCYRLARDMRVVAVWAGTGDPHASDPEARGSLRKLRLGDSSCPLTADGTVSVKESPVAPANFPYHPADFTITATFRTPAQVFPGGADQLTITQTYQFAPYGLDPPHEPGGVLPAARLLPLVTARCDQIGGEGDPDIRYIRIDYRMNYALETFDPDLGPPKWGQKADAPNQAGIFRDQEGPPPLTGTPIEDFPLPPRPGPTIDAVFTAGEKPLTYEIVGRGLEHGRAYSPAGAPWSWDNIHQWPSAQKLPDTPGAFDACHTHWRWGAVSGDSGSWAAQIPMAPSPAAGRQLAPIPAAGPQFQGYLNYGWSTGGGGPLIDHRVPDQSITFAITGHRAHPDADVSTPIFADLFTGRPRDISAGDDLVQWFSIELFRNQDDLQSPWEGMVFIHGLYFAHSQEPLWVAARAAYAGLTAPLHNPPEQSGRPWTINPA